MIGKAQGETARMPVITVQWTTLAAPKIRPAATRIEPPSNGAELREIRIKRSLGRVVCEIHKSDGTLAMLDANTGAMLSPLSEQQALLYAQRDFTGAGQPVSVHWLTEHNAEYHKALRVWRVDFNNEENSHV